MNTENVFGDYSFYWLSILCTLPFTIYYCLKTLNKDRATYWTIYEDGDEKFDFEFLLKIFFQLCQIYFASFTFINVIYFVFYGKWYSDDSLRSSKGFIFIGAVTYIITLIQKSSNIVYDHKQKKIKISKGIKKEDDTQKREKSE